MKNKQLKYLNADALFFLLYSGFDKIKDYRSKNNKFSLADTLMSAFVMFSLKSPSLLNFEKKISNDSNLMRIYNVDNVPCDTQMREILDEVDPAAIEHLFVDVFRCQRR